MLIKYNKIFFAFLHNTKLQSIRISNGIAVKWLTIGQLH
jgi:hypothetical protein